ncbi:YhgE/Pip domain-containing protein [Bacillus aerolatus]|uniref:YhgE/Pip domain-containing protein n=1 Tax=Bacillus aerolatus TaxID=2653354 RepID=A0A6I1FH85_9BACI|nr:YhgE/Pip domain-containing protein [Bacillus aerolatus]KAB7704960.1 YhgE/Pip domain-containing protein [Bacillus aerolatus]
MMKKSLFIAELKDILSNRMLLISILAVLFIPLLYAGTLLWAFWDPYSQLEDLPVAVVNKDSGADFEGEKLTLGKELIKEIDKSDDFDFRLVSEHEAKKGLDNQTFYMMIEIPANFSKNATTLLEEKPEKLELKYVPNESFNFLSAQMGETAVKEIRTSVQKSVTKTYSETMFEKIKLMGEGLSSASDGAGELGEGAEKLSEGAIQIKENLAALADNSIQFSEGISKAGNGSKELASGAAKLNSGLAQLEEGQNKLAAGSEELQNGANNLAVGISSLQTGLHTVDGKMEELNSGTAEMKKGVEQFQEKLPELTKGTKELASGAEQLNNGLGQFEEQLIAELNGSINQQLEQYMPLLQQKLTPVEIAVLKQQVAQQQQQMAEKIKSSVGELQTGSAKLASGAKEVNGAISGQLAPNIKSLNEGLGKVQTGQQQLKAGVHELALGSDQLAGGAGKLQSGEKELTEGMNQLSEKLSEAKNGSAELAGGAETLSGGLGQLNSGSAKLSEGAGKLAEGSVDLENGSAQMKEGTKELHEKLEEAAEKANEVKGKEETYDMMAEPVKVDKEVNHHVPNYGTGIAPYFLSLGLFVGALMLTIVFQLREPAKRPTNGFSWFLGKFGVLFLAGLAQSLLVSAILLYGLNIEVQSVPLFILTAVITSLTFMAIIQMLVTMWGNPGRFIAVLILILQLTASAGTFPLELIPKALQPFNSILPMAYSVRAFKAVISSGDFDFMWVNNGVLGLFAAGCILITMLFFKRLFKRQYGIEKRKAPVQTRQA